MSRRGLVGLMALCLGACDGKDVGSLITPPQPPPPCVGDECNPLCTGPDCNPPPACDPSQPDLTCGVGACARTAPACIGEVDNTCTPGAPIAEKCNDIDDDCDELVDEGCDDDGDLYCDADFEVVGTPAICPKGGDRRLDCDDENPRRHSALPEICDDGIDNNCNDRADYLDFEGCTHVSASFEDSDGLKAIEHGSRSRVQASLTPPSVLLERTWSVSMAEPTDQCAAEDVRLEDPVETAGTTERMVSIVNDPAKLVCRYELALAIDGTPADTLQLRMNNRRPIVGAIRGGTFDENTIVVTLPEGRTPQIIATIPDDDDAPVTLRWRGADVGQLSCSPNCVGDRVQFTNPPAAGRYALQVQAADAFDGVFRNRNVSVQVVPCVWARPDGAGDGRGPAIAQAQPDLRQAIRDASAAGSNVCFAGAAQYTLFGLLNLPRDVGLIGGFDGGGAPANNRATLSFTSAGRLTFAAGHAGIVKRITLVGGEATPVVTVRDAQPVLDGVQIEIQGGSDQIGVLVRAIDAPAAPTLISSTVRITGSSAGALGVRVTSTGPHTAALHTAGATDVDIDGCRGTCRGVEGRGRADLQLSGRHIDVQAVGAGSEAVGVEIVSQDGLRPTGSIRGHTRISAFTTNADPADLTVGVRLLQSQGVLITDNVLIGARTETSGRRLSAGIADGAVFSDGSLRRGDSTGLRVEGNRRIAAGRWRPAWTVDACPRGASPPANAIGTEIGAGLLLVGTTSATVSGNGNTFSRDNGVFGAATSAAWTDAGRRLPPSVPGLWTIDTRDVLVHDNELRGGVLTTIPGCPAPATAAVEVVRDGLAPFMQPSLPSTGLRVTANGIVTARSGPLLAAPRINDTPAIGVALGGPGDVVTSNNFVAVTRGATLTAVHAWQARALRLTNDTYEVEGLGAAQARLERGIVLEAPEDGAVSVRNSIILLRDTGSTGAIALDLPTGGSEGLRAFAHNLLFIETAVRDPSSAYAHVGGALYDESAFADLEATLPGGGNVLGPPLLQSYAIEHRRPLGSLSARSPALDAGSETDAPAEDYFGTPRPQGAAVDIGHHERRP